MKYFKRFLKCEMFCLMFWAAVHLICILIMWFVDLQFPWSFVDFDKELRAWFAAYVVLTCIGCLIAAIETPKLSLSEEIAYRNAALDRQLISKKSASSKNKTSALDIAVGVGAGIIGAEIVSDIFDIGD